MQPFMQSNCNLVQTRSLTVCRCAEEALLQAVVEARRAAPAILFLPHLQLWWETAPHSLKASLWMMLVSLEHCVFGS